jgi:hypothetical protein
MPASLKMNRYSRKSIRAQTLYAIRCCLCIYIFLKNVPRKIGSIHDSVFTTVSAGMSQLFTKHVPKKSAHSMPFDVAVCPNYQRNFTDDDKKRNKDHSDASLQWRRLSLGLRRRSHHLPTLRWPFSRALPLRPRPSLFGVRPSKETRTD